MSKHSMTATFGRTARRGAAALALFGTMIWTSGCDLQVDNPGSIADEDLEVPGAIQALVNGAKGRFGYATTIPGGGGTYLSGALLTDELVHVGSWQPVRMLSDGISMNTEPEQQTRWAFSSQARWIAEDAIRRIERVLGESEARANGPYLDAHLYAGFSNRMMGDTFCNAVIDGGPMEDYRAFHTRAVSYLTDAIALAQAQDNGHVLTAAYGARAQARVMLGDWTGAVADAGQVPTNYVYEQIHSDNSTAENNTIYRWTTLGFEGNQTSVWGTPFAQWGTEINDDYETEGDPRVRFEVTYAVVNGETVIRNGGDNRRPLYYAHKYSSTGDNIPIVKGTEMRLIEAEALLLDGQWQQALDKMNEVRAYRDLDDLTAANADEARVALMKEKGIELWLEGRRLPDLRRWANDNNWSVPFQVVRQQAPGQPATADPFVNVMDVERMCLEVSANEIASNPNI